MKSKVFKKSIIKKEKGITIWLVDGKYIRDNIDINFTNFGQHYKYNFIPSNEFWIDHLVHKEEIYYFIEHLFIEKKLMKNKVPYDDALIQANVVERELRKEQENSIRKIKIKKLWTLKENIEIWLVEGIQIRNTHYIDFTQGGHDLVYDFVPKNNIFIDNDVIKEERLYILIHEFIERSLMSTYVDYEIAHILANKLEEYYRKSSVEEAEKFLISLLEG